MLCFVSFKNAVLQPPSVEPATLGRGRGKGVLLTPVQGPSATLQQLCLVPHPLPLSHPISLNITTQPCHTVYTYVGQISLHVTGFFSYEARAI